MNALPVELRKIVDADGIPAYFRDLERVGFDVAWINFRADEFHSDVERHRQACLDFAAEARRVGCPACIRIPTMICSTAHLGVQEAQYDFSNKHLSSGPESFYASPASDAWKERVKGLVTLFIRDLDFDWVVVEEPAFLVDVPGTKDRLHGRFSEAHPDEAYPSSTEETSEFLMVQQLKADVAAGFCLDIAAHAKELGAKRVGVVPQTFLPSARAKAERIPRTAADLGRIAQSADVDFLVTGMDPSSVLSGAVLLDGEPAKSPDVYYAEVAAHSLGKPVIVTVSPAAGTALAAQMPPNFCTDVVMSSLAAGAVGFIGVGCDNDAGEGKCCEKAVCDAASCSARLGHPFSPAAFVFSDSGGRHAPPNDYETVFRHYWAFAKGMATRAHMPLLTFHSESLQTSLAQHPEVRVLIFEEHFPMSVEQMLVIRDWWETPERRVIVAFASGEGLSADPGYPGARPCTQSLPGVLELIGLKQDADQLSYAHERPIGARDVSRVRRSAFLQSDTDTTFGKVADVRRVFGSRASILYEADLDDPRIPIVAEWKDRATLAIFCGFGLDKDTAHAAELAVGYALRETNSLIDVVAECSDGLIWNINRHGYLILTNTSDKKGTAVGKADRSTFWDCRQQKMLPDGDAVFSVAPHSFEMYRVVGRRSKFFDITGVSYLRSLMDGAGRADIDILAGKQTTLVLRNVPREVTVDGKSCAVAQEVVNGAYHMTLQQCLPGDRKISLKW